MSESDYKASFMLDQSMLDIFCNFLTQHGTTQSPTSKFQIKNIDIEGGDVLVYKSGVIIFDDNTPIRKLIGKFLSQHDIDEELEKYRVGDQDDSKTQGWEETPKGVWLTPTQVDALLANLQEELEFQEGDKHERGRFVRGNETLVVNNNGVVYTIGGFKGFFNILRDIVTTHDPYEDYDRVIILDEYGRWERLGPVGVVIVDLMVPEIVELQLAGVKDDSLSRNIDHLELMPLIEENSTYQSLILSPDTVNTEVSDRDQYLEYLDSRYRELLAGQLLNLNEQTLVIVDKNLEELLDHTQKLVVNRDQRVTPALGISSTILHAKIAKWKEDWYKKLGIEIERHNLVKIRDHPNVEYLAKTILL